MVSSQSLWWLYLVRMANGALYCGVTTDVNRRFAEHCESGIKTAKALRGKGPLELVYTYQAEDKQQAMQQEWRVKKLNKKQKEALIKGQLQLPL